MENIIEISNLNKSFKDVKAVDNLSFHVKKKEFFAFLGINGAGKSTTISIMCGTLRKDSGIVKINGFDVNTEKEQIKKEIGVVFQESSLDKILTVYDNLEYKASLYGITGKDFKERLEYLSTLFSFKELLKRTYGKLSGGQKRKIDIARALLHKPNILILDEPTTGLDPKTRQIVWNAINKIHQEEGLTVFLTTHYMEEVVDANYVIILDSGRIKASGTPLELKNKYTGDYIYLYNPKMEDIEKLNVKFEKIPDGVKIEVANTQEATKLIMDYPLIFKDYEVIKGKMDDVFLSVTGKKLETEN